jgi:hypothetical protein
MECDGSPNPSISGEINTFLTLCKEDMDSQDLKNLFDIIDLALKVLINNDIQIKIFKFLLEFKKFKLINELDFLIDDHPEDDSEQLKEQYKKVF